MKIELPDMNKMPNVNKSIVLKYVHSLNFFQTIISYAIHWTSTRKVVQLQKWIVENVDIPEDLKQKVEYIKNINDVKDQIREILKFVHNNIKYIGDMENWGVNEYWQTPTETWTEKIINGKKSRYGDCEDGAILIYAIAKYVGIPDYHLKIVAGSVDGGGHCYIVFMDSKGMEYPVDWCIVDNSYTHINTPTGKKRISELKVGDEVIGYDEKNKKPAKTKIVKIGKRKTTDIMFIDYQTPNAKKKTSTILCTPEHPWLTKRGWIQTKDLKDTDIIYYCNGKSLNNLFNPKRKEMYKRNSKRMVSLNKEKKEYFKKRMKLNNPMFNPECVEKVYSERLKKQWKSKPETKFEAFIEENKLPIYFVGDGSFWVRGKNPDFRIANEKKVIEVTEYGYLGRDEKWARERCKHFEDNGFKCFVVFYDKKKMLTLKEDLIKFIFNGVKIKKVGYNRSTRKCDKEKEVWNMHCEPHNNYFVNGLLSHNCYWYNTSYSWNLFYVFRDDYFNGLKEWFRFNCTGAYKIKQIAKFGKN